MSNKTVNEMENGILLYGVLTPYQGNGEPKVLLHQVTKNDVTGELQFGSGILWVTDSAALLKIVPPKVNMPPASAPTPEDVQEVVTPEIIEDNTQNTNEEKDVTNV